MNTNQWILSFLVLIFLLAGAGLAYAQTGGSYDLSWHTADGGGTDLTGGGYTLSGTAGQPDAAASALSGSGYSLTGGFWAGASATSSGQKVYLPVVVKNQ